MVFILMISHHKSITKAISYFPIISLPCVMKLNVFMHVLNLFLYIFFFQKLANFFDPRLLSFVWNFRVQCLCYYGKFLHSIKWLCKLQCNSTGMAWHVSWHSIVLQQTLTNTVTQFISAQTIKVTKFNLTAQGQWLQKLMAAWISHLTQWILRSM